MTGSFQGDELGRYRAGLVEQLLPLLAGVERRLVALLAGPVGSTAGSKVAVAGRRQLRLLQVALDGHWLTAATLTDGGPALQL